MTIACLNTISSTEGNSMQKYQCSVCGHIYDPEVVDPDSDIAPGTAFEDLPDDWSCPVCGAKKSQFAPWQQAT